MVATYGRNLWISILKWYKQILCKFLSQVPFSGARQKRPLPWVSCVPELCFSMTWAPSPTVKYEDDWITGTTSPPALAGTVTGYVKHHTSWNSDVVWQALMVQSALQHSTDSRRVLITSAGALYDGLEAVFRYSQNHRIKDWLRLERTLEVTWSNPLSPAGPPTASCPGSCPDGFWLSPRLETSQLNMTSFLASEHPATKDWLKYLTYILISRNLAQNYTMIYSYQSFTCGTQLWFV